MLRKVSVAINVLRKNGFLGELQCLADNPPTLKMEDSANIKMVLQGTFKKNVLDRWKHYVEFDPLTDALQPVLTINGVSYELGIFLPTTVTPSYKGTAVEETIEIEAYDRSWLVATTTGTERVFFARGTAYMEAIEQLLVASGIALIKSTPCSDVLHEDREDWDLGTDYLTIINDLLKEINYKQLWFDFTGTAVLEPIETPMVKNIKHTLDARSVTSLVHPGLSRKLDIYGIPNVFICTCNNPEKSAVLTAIARNENDHSPLSIQRRGREIVYYENVNNVASQEALQEYADRLLFISMMSGETMSVTTSLLPNWGIGDIVSLHYLNVHALCVSHSWNMTLAAGGTMTHYLEKIVYNLDSGIYTDDDDSDDEEYEPYNPWGDDDSNTDTNTDDNIDDDGTLPDEIRITVLPVKLQYSSGEQIDTTGITVRAYKDGSVWTNVNYPSGYVPVSEVSASFSNGINYLKDTIVTYTLNKIPAGTVMRRELDNDAVTELHIESEVFYADIECYAGGALNVTPNLSSFRGFYSDSPFTILEILDTPNDTAVKHREYERIGIDTHDNGLYTFDADMLLPQGRYTYDLFRNTSTFAYRTPDSEYTAYDVIKDGFPKVENLHNESIIVSWVRPGDGQILTASYSITADSYIEYEQNIKVYGE